ncbi:MAG: AAA family ATPase [Phycisphaera sp.]|nr:AAA family ATPase [Phycisphaera sp.]
MPRHSDAIGYLLELRDEIGFDWFRLACDLAIASHDGSVSDDDRIQLWEQFVSTTPYTPRSISPTPSASSASPIPHSWIEALGGFLNFRRLTDSLQVSFSKPLTVIFGTNGSGKSSICDTVRILASASPPPAEYANVRSRDKPYGFDYKFRDQPPAKWNSGDGFGVHAGALRYFDTTIAMRHIESSLDAGRVVELSPFRLEVFDYCRALIRALKTVTENKAEGDRSAAQALIDPVVKGFGNELPTDETAISSLFTGDGQPLKAAIEAHVSLTEADAKASKEAEATITRLKLAGSAEGVRALKAEVQLLKQLARWLDEYTTTIGTASVRDTMNKHNELDGLREQQSDLVKAVTPSDLRADSFVKLIRVAYEVASINKDRDDCPLCKQALSDDAKVIFTKYHELVASELSARIETAEGELDKMQKCLFAAKRMSLLDLAPYKDLLADEICDRIKHQFDAMVTAIPAKVDDSTDALADAFEEAGDVDGPKQSVVTAIMAREGSIATAESGNEARDNEIAAAEAIVRSYKYRLHFENSLNTLKKIASHLTGAQTIDKLVAITDFPTVLRKMTNLGKQVHDELVIDQFRHRLDAEYKALTGKVMADFGIELVRRGADQDVTIDPQIGGAEIHRVLSEGEQKVHALSLFLAEVSVSPTDVIVLDDPVNSFDYNYTRTFCERLRDLVLATPDRQFIIFTHSWEFFCRIQNVLNNSGLNNNYEIQVVEECSSVQLYKEKVAELKHDVQQALAIKTLSRRDKENVAKWIRILAEVVVNSSAFNGQRQQYKQSGLKVSDFTACTKLVALTNDEATTLKDVFGRMSPQEHDDASTFYTAMDVGILKASYEDVLKVEEALVARRPK